MSKYKILIEETLTREVIVAADNEDDAYLKVRNMYFNSEVVLSADDYCDVTFIEKGEVDEG